MKAGDADKTRAATATVLGDWSINASVWIVANLFTGSSGAHRIAFHDKMTLVVSCVPNIPCSSGWCNNFYKFLRFRTVVRERKNMVTCWGCDKVLTGKQKKWCSDRCRRRASRPKGHIKRCKGCDCEFRSVRKDAVWCTDKCRLRYQRRNRLLSLTWAMAKGIDALCQSIEKDGFGGSELENDELSRLWPELEGDDLDDKLSQDGLA